MPGDGYSLGPVSDCSYCKKSFSYTKVKLPVQLLPIIPCLPPWDNRASILFLALLEVLETVMRSFLILLQRGEVQYLQSFLRGQYFRPLIIFVAFL